MNDSGRIRPETPDDERSSLALDARRITVEFRRAGRSPMRAVDEVDLFVNCGETLGLVGESGSGKSSIGKALAQLPPPTRGSVRVDGVDLTTLSTRSLRPVRRRLQMIFQDPISSLNPRRTALEIVAEPLRVARHSRPRQRAAEVLAEVGVDEQMSLRRPHELSGGQCQRVSIARAIAQEPELLICDEPVSALDVSVQAQVLNLLEIMKRDYHLSMIFISHDLAVVSNISDRVAVMYLGRLCEIASSTMLYANPKHHYSQLLLSSVPKPGSRRAKDASVNEIGSAAKSGTGCPFAPRCPAATDICRTDTPELTEIEPGHFAACHHPLEHQPARPPTSLVGGKAR